MSKKRSFYQSLNWSSKPILDTLEEYINAQHVETRVELSKDLARAAAASSWHEGEGLRRRTFWEVQPSGGQRRSVWELDTDTGEWREI